MKSTKPHKAPMSILPARPLRALCAPLEHGDNKHGPGTWRDHPDTKRAMDALLRHVTSAADPSQPDIDDESGCHHLQLAGANILILLEHLGIDYSPPKSSPAYQGAPAGTAPQVEPEPVEDTEWHPRCQQLGECADAKEGTGPGEKGCSGVCEKLHPEHRVVNIKLMHTPADPERIMAAFARVTTPAPYTQWPPFGTVVATCGLTSTNKGTVRDHVGRLALGSHGGPVVEGQAMAYVGMPGDIRPPTAAELARYQDHMGSPVEPEPPKPVTRAVARALKAAAGATDKERLFAMAMVRQAAGNRSLAARIAGYGGSPTR